MNLPDIGSEDLRQAGELATSLSKTYLGKKFLALIGDRFKRRLDRKEKQADATDEVSKIVVTAQAEAQADLIRFKGDLEKGEFLKEYISRSGSRFINERIRKDYNLDSALEFTAEQLTNEPETASQSKTEETVKEDWFTRWTSIVEDISEEEVQRVWGRLLAGEISRPGSFSLRTLEVLRNLSKQDADLINKIAGCVISLAESSLILGRAEDFNNTKYGISYVELLRLFELTILQQGNVAKNFPIIKRSTSLDIPLFHAKRLFFFENRFGQLSPELKEFRLTGLVFTSVGHEILQLTQPEINSRLIEEVKKEIMRFMNASSSMCYMTDKYSINEEGILTCEEAKPFIVPD